jgi:hypothetical protein
MAKQPPKKKSSSKSGYPVVNTPGKPAWKLTSMQNGTDKKSKVFNYAKGDSTMTVKSRDGKITEKSKGVKKKK